MTPNNTLLCSAISLIGLVAGCATPAVTARPSWRYEMPTTDKQAYAIAYDSRGRGAYLSFANGFPLLCAEPPPDTSANLASNSSSSVSGSTNVGYGALTAAAAAQGSQDQTVTSTVADVVKRSELNLLVRDIFYRLCEMQFNGNFRDANGSDDKQAILTLFNKTVDATLALGERDNITKMIDLAGAQGVDPTTRTLLVNAAVQAMLGQVIASPATDVTAKARIGAYLMKLSDGDGANGRPVPATLGGGPGAPHPDDAAKSKAKPQ